MKPALSVHGLNKTFRSGGRTVKAVDNVSFEIAVGETLALAGPSGSGKSTVARLVTRVLAAESGSVMLAGVDFMRLSGGALRRQRRHLQMVFQDSTAAFNPRITVGAAIEAPLRIHGIVPARERGERVAELLQRVGIDPALSARGIHEISGGQRQRVSLARALACEPSVILLDEALSAVDASRRGELVDLLLDLQRDRRIAYLFISHDLALIHAMAHRVAIMAEGRIVEEGTTAEVIRNPSSETARALIAAAPKLEIPE